MKPVFIKPNKAPVTNGVNPSKRPPEPTNFTPSAPGVTPPKKE